jgi:hypothetical protein
VGPAPRQQLGPFTGQAPVNRSVAHPPQQLRLRIGDLQGLFLAQHRDEFGHYRRQQLPGRCPQHRPAEHQSRLQIRAIHRCPAGPHPPGFGRVKGMPQHRPGMVPVPAGQLNDLVQDPSLPDPVPGPIGPGQLLRHGLALSHRQSHPPGVTRVRPPGNRQPSRRIINEATYPPPRRLFTSQHGGWHHLVHGRSVVLTIKAAIAWFDRTRAPSAEPVAVNPWRSRWLDGMLTLLPGPSVQQRSP